LATDLKAAGGNVPAGLVSAIIGTIGELDGSYPSPEDVGWESLRQWLRNEPPSIRQSWRQQILQTAASDFKDFTARVANWQQKSIAAVLSQNSISFHFRIDYRSKEKQISAPTWDVCLPTFNVTKDAPGRT
jgi:hypothetical protein